MWGQWKDKIMDLFYTDVEDEEEKETKKRQTKPSMLNNEKLETKVMYQYPENREFRFPVIPDRVEQKKPVETPAFKRRERDEFKRKKKEPKADNEQKKPVSSEKEQEKPTVKKVPFSVTEIPSPIHGFQKQKQEKEVENVPAYVRKLEIEDTQDKKVEQIVTETSNEEVEQVAIETPVKNVQSKPSSTSDDQSEKVVEETQASVEKVETKQQKPTRKKKQNPISDQTKQEGTLPFNVMMSSNDKRRHGMRPEKSMPVAATTEPVERANDSHEIPNHLLNDPTPKNNNDQHWVRDQQELLEKTLKHFNVQAKVVNATQGPAVTRFEVQPEIGVKVSKVKNLSDDLKLNMAARDIRIEAPIPGKNTIGIEIPNQTSQMVGLQEIFETNA